MTIEQGIQEIGDLVTPQNLQEQREPVQKKEKPEIKNSESKPQTVVRRRPGFNRIPPKRRGERVA